MSVPSPAFAAVARKAPHVYEVMTRALAARLASSYQLASSLAHARVEDRIVTTLLTLLPRLGRGLQKTANEGRIHMTRKELADLTGTTPETAIRITKNLEREGYLELGRPGIIKIVDVAKLKQLAVAEK